jgi:hypothetical protein
MRHVSKSRVLIISALLAACGLGLLGGCNSRNLFNDDDRTSDRLKYFDNDSAVDSTKNHKDASQMGYGMGGGGGGSQ